MNTPLDEESGTERVMDWLVALVGLGPKIIILLWVLLAGGVPLALQGNAADMSADRAVPTMEAMAEATIEIVAATPAPEETVTMLELVPAVQPPTIDEAGVLAPGDFGIDLAPLGFAWAAQQVAGAAVDPSNRQPGMPPHLLVDLTESDGVALEAVDPAQPQIRIMPIAAYLSMLEAAGTPNAAAAFDSLKALLEQGNVDAGADIPTPPLMGEMEQQPIARIEVIPFEGGQGIGYVAHYAEAPGLITNDNGLDYIVQGLTDDGAHYVLVVWPLGATFLPGTAADVPEATLSAIQSDIAGYLSTIGDETEAAADADFTPDLGALRRALGTIAIGAGAAELASTTDAAQTEAPQLAGTVWQWTAFEDTAGLNDITVDNPSDFWIIFSGDGAYSLKADCNVGGGSYVVDGANLTINPGMSTLAFCGEDSLDDEFRAKLFDTASYVFDDDGNLVLNLMADAGNMVFANGGSVELVDAGEPAEQPDADDAGLTSTAFQWTILTEADGTVVTVDNPENYQVVLNPDGTFNFRADCNVGSGTYEYNEDGSIVFLPGPMTLAFCGEESLDQQFLAALTGTVSFTVDDAGNVTADLGDGRTATLINAGPVSVDGEMIETSMGEPDDLIGTTWQWIRFDDTADLNNIVVPDPENYTLTLWPDGTFNFRADCNVGGGAYELGGSRLALTVGATTRALCPPESLSDTFIARLGETATYVFDDDGNLVLNLFADAGNMVFRPGDPAELGETAPAEDQPGAADAGLTGLSFNWATFTDADGNPVTVENPDDYSVVLLPDGTFTFQADCNVGRGTYTYADDGTISLDVGPITRALCPPNSLSDDFVTFLGSITGAVANPDGTVTVTTADGSEASFLAGGPAEIPQVSVPEAGSGASTGPESGIFETIWNWTSLEDADGATTITVDDPTRYQVLFGTDATYFLRADCNTGSGAFSGQGDETIDALTITPGISTLAACGPDSLDTEFTTNLFTTESYTFDDAGNLRLALAGGGTMVFANGGAATELTSQPEPQVQPTGPADPLVGTTWQWVNFRDAKQDYSITGDYTIEFLPDGAVAVVADCNNGNGSYTVDGSSLNVSILVVTAAACAEGSLDGVFIEYLNQAAAFSIDGTTMRIDLFADGGTMTFTQVP